MKQIALLILMMMLLSGMCHALGVAPARATFSYEKDTDIKNTIRVNVENVPSRIILSTEGELGDYIKLEKNQFIADTKEKEIKYELELPKSGLKPGKRLGKIIIVELPEVAGGEKEMVIATTAVVHQVWLNVPFPGKYVEGKLYASNTQVDSDIILTTALMSFGDQDISDAHATIYVRSPTNEELAVIETGSESISSGKEVSLIGKWKTPNTGRYSAESIVDYDGTQLVLDTVFEVGKKTLDVENLVIKDFKLGQIVQVDVKIRNRWNLPLTPTGEIVITKDGHPIGTIDILPKEIPARSSKILSGYWDTKDLTVGEYSLSVDLKADGEKNSQSFEAIASLDGFTVKGEVSGNVVATDITRVSLLTIFIAVLIMVNIALFFYVVRKTKTKK